jgi:hypothetical protein
VPAERLDEDHLEVRPGQGRQLQALHHLVAPQGRDRVGCGLAAADGRQHEGGAAGGQVVQQGRRGVVEQVRVVHAHHQPPALGPGEQRVGRLAQQVHPAGGLRQVGRQQLRERAERDAGGGARGHRPAGAGAPRVDACERLDGQAGLADPGVAGDDDAGRARVAHRPFDELELRAPSDQRPCGDHRPDRRACPGCGTRPRP